MFLFPSTYDTSGIVVKEAAACDCPALLVEGSCSAEGVTHGGNGFLCQDTVESIAQGIAAALPDAAAVGEQAKQTIPIPWDRLMKDVLGRYERLIDMKRERSHA